MRVLHLIALAAGLGLAACMTSVQSFREEGLARAAFEMRCPASQLSVVELANSADWRGVGAQVGVTGCGRRIVYIKTENGWVANTTSTDSGKR